MSTQVNMHEAKTQFSKLAELVENGEDVVIARSGKPIMKLVKIDQVQEPIKPGFGKDLFAAFDDATLARLDVDVNQLFEE